MIFGQFYLKIPIKSWHTCTVKMNMLYLINKIVATDYKQYYLLNWTN